MPGIIFPDFLIQSKSKWYKPVVHFKARGSVLSPKLRIIKVAHHGPLASSVSFYTPLAGLSTEYRCQENELNLCDLGIANPPS